MNTETQKIQKQISYLTWFFMVSLAISGLTAIPVKSGISFLLGIVPGSWTLVYSFLDQIRQALWSTPEVLFYGYDWLAFAHVVIAILFYGLIRDPVRNMWIVEFGMIACGLIIPFAFIMGSLRGIPVWWRLIDCSFGVFGMIPLMLMRNKILRLQKLIEKEKLNVIF